MTSLMIQLASAVSEKPRSSNLSGDKYPHDRIEYKLKVLTGTLLDIQKSWMNIS